MLQGTVSEYFNVSGGVAPGFKQYVPGVEEATRTTFIVDSPNFTDSEGNTVSASRDILLADTSFFHVFKRRILVGDPAEILTVPLNAMVSNPSPRNSAESRRPWAKSSTTTTCPRFP